MGAPSAVDRILNDERPIIPKGKNLTVSRVFFRGNHTLDEDEIIPSLWVTPRPWSVWGEPIKLDRRKLADDILRIENIYKKAGYYEARVADVEVELRPDGRSVDITFVVEEGKPVRVKETTRIVYPGAASDEVAALERLNPMKIGDVFSIREFEGARIAIRSNLRNRGFYSAEVTPETWVFPDEYAAYTTFTIAAGPQVRFGDTVIEGNDSVTDNIVFREVNWERGDWYDESKVESTSRDLNALNLFRVVRIRPRYPGRVTDVMPMVVQVTEAPFQNLRFGLGYGTEDRVRVQGRYNHYNVFGGGRTFDALIRMSFLLRSVELTLTQPFFFSKKNTIGITTAYRQQVIQDAFSFERYTLRPQFTHRFNPHWAAYTGYQLEYNRAYDIQEGIPLRNRNSADPGYLSGVFFSVERTNVDSLILPYRGNSTRLYWLQAGKFLGGKFDFYKWTLESVQYLYPLRRTVIELRGKAGVAEPYPGSRVPLYEKFFAGGTRSVRGYRQDRLGPQIGGRTLVELNSELRRRVYGSFWVAGFADMGMVGLREYSWEQNQVRWGVGPGIRATTLVGLIRADVGIPLDPRLGEPTWRFHISIGQAF